MVILVFLLYCVLYTPCTHLRARIDYVHFVRDDPSHDDYTMMALFGLPVKHVYLFIFDSPVSYLNTLLFDCVHVSIHMFISFWVFSLPTATKP